MTAVIVELRADSGQRGDKVRTIRCQDGLVTDHRLGRRLTLDAYLRGDWDMLLGA